MNTQAERCDKSVLYFRDMRVNSWRWRPLIEKYGHLRMFIDPDYLKTATFLVEDGDPASTVFFIRVPLWNLRVPSGYDYFAVTTKHSVEDIEVAIRFNLKRGGMHDEPTNPGDWILHPETDVAILPIEFPLDEYDLMFIDTYEISAERDYLISVVDDPRSGRTVNPPDEKLLLHRYGVGDEVYSIGLFPGRGITQPAARFGHISLSPAPGEKIIAYVGRHGEIPIDAFLIEIATMKGQSGSPVFLRPWVREERDKPRPLWEYNFLVGMIQGFYPVEHDARIQGRKFKLTVDTGLGIVIPSQSIIEMLMEDSLVKRREEKLQKMREEKAAAQIKPESASRTTPSAQGFTQESFEEALRRASRKLPDEGKEESE